MVVGKVENWINILDLAQLSFTSLPKAWIIAFIKSFSSTTYARSRVMYLLQSGMAVRMMWNIVKIFVHPTTSKKLIFSKTGTDPGLQALAHPSQLQKQYGGKADDVTVFWPPYAPSDEYGVDLKKLKDKNEYDASLIFDEPLVLPNLAYPTNISKGVTHKIDVTDTSQVKLEVVEPKITKQTAVQKAIDDTNAPIKKAKEKKNNNSCCVIF